MIDLYLSAIFSDICLIILGLIIYHFIKKNRKHKDFFLVVITCGFFGLLAFYLFTTSLIDIIQFKMGHFHTAEGICEIYFFEASHRNPSRYDIHIEGLNLTANSEDFSHLEEGTIACKATYLKATGTLIDIEFN